MTVTCSPAGRLPIDRDQLRTLHSLIRVRNYIYLFNSTPDESKGISNAVNCYKKAVQFNSFFDVTVCQFLLKFVIWFKTHYCPMTWSDFMRVSQNVCWKLHVAFIVLSVINWTHCSCADNRQIRLEICAELDLVGFPGKGQIPNLLEHRPKCSTSAC